MTVVASAADFFVVVLRRLLEFRRFRRVLPPPIDEIDSFYYRVGVSALLYGMVRLFSKGSNDVALFGLSEQHRTEL